MYPSRLLSAIAALLLCSTAFAQMRMPRDITAPSPSPAPSAQAPAPASTPASAPSANAAKEEAGQLAASGWLILVDRRNWGGAWDNAGPVFRSAVPLGTWMDGVPKLRDPLGALIERKPIQAFYNTSLQGRPPGDYVTTVFQSRFETKQIEEVVTMALDPDGKWRVTGYATR